MNFAESPIKSAQVRDLKILIWVDEPQLISFETPDSSTRLAVAVPMQADGCWFFSAVVNSPDLERYTECQADLRETLLSGSEHAIFELEGDKVTLIPCGPFENFLPSAGLYASAHTH